MSLSKSVPGYDHKSIATSFDSDFSLDYRDNYTSMINYEREANTIRIREKDLFFIMFLLGDRYFPTFMEELTSLNGVDVAIKSKGGIV